MSLNTLPCNPYPISTEELNKGNNDDLNTRVSALETAVEEIDNDKADLGVIAAEFDAEAGVYAVGDLVMYQGKLYEFTTAHETAGDWDSTEVTEKTVSDEIDTVKSGLTNVANQLIAQNTRVYFKPNYRNNANANVKTVKNIPANHVGLLITYSGIYVFKSNAAGNGFEVPQGSDLTITNTGDSYTFSCPGAWYTMCLFIFTWDPDYVA